VKSLVVLLDESAPSFCYYEAHPSASPRRMTRAMLERVLALADAHALALQLLCGHEGIEPFVRHLVGQRPYTRYLPVGVADAAPDDVLIVDGPECDSRLWGPNRHPVCVLRLRPDDLELLPETWERLSEHAYRIVLVLVELDRYDESALSRYEKTLLDVRQRLAAKYLRGVAAELSVVSDRLGLDSPVECGAGIDHLTVTPNGDLHICPGFAVDGEPPVGSVAQGWNLPNAALLERARAPICGSCDAFHCRRCVYMNRRATLEINTPAWQVCRAGHIEREASRVMLASLHQRRCMEGIRPIAPLDYADPLNRLMQVRHAIPHGASAVPRQAAPAERPAPLPTASDGISHSSHSPHRAVGRVTPEERDEIQELFQRKVGLTALVTTLARMESTTLESTPLYERVVRDMGETTLAYDGWWEKTAEKYRWTRERPDQKWHVDFATCEVLLR
jgi:CXXX repeat modification system protein